MGRRAAFVLLVLATFAAETVVTQKPARSNPAPAPDGGTPPPPPPPPPPVTHEHLAEANGVFLGIPACVDPGTRGAQERNCKMGTEIHRISVTEGCFEYHAPIIDESLLTAEQIQSERNLEGSHMGWYFEYNNVTGTGMCLPVPPDRCVKCIPFVSEAGCTDECAEWMDDAELSHEREVEKDEELLETWEDVYHFLKASYLCFALALLCEDFFVAALDIIIMKMDLPPDVAGATFMAAGTSSPELFTASVGVFITGDAVGVGAVVGSTMFNTLCIVGGSAIACGKLVALDNRIFYRDGCSYAFAILVLACCLYDGELTPLESWVLLVVYVAYVTLCAVYNSITSRFCPKFTHSADEIDIEEMARTSSSWTSPMAGEGDGIRMSVVADRNRASVVGHAQEDFAAVKVAKAHRLGGDDGAINMQRNMLARRLVASILKGELDMVAGADQESGRAGYDEQLTDEDLRRSIKTVLKGDANGLLAAWDQVGTDSEEMLVSSGEHSGDHGGDGHNIFKVPAGATRRAFWAVSFPSMLLFTYTIPDCRKNEKLYLLTFAASIAYMGTLVAFMVDSCETLGEWSGMSVSTLGLTFVAVGTSFPDCLASLLVAKKGAADMAISNAFGSNIFDILLGLGLPWMLQTCVADPGSSVYPYATVCEDAPCTENDDCAQWDNWCNVKEGQCVIKVNTGDQEKINSSMVLLLGSFFFMLLVIKLSKWKLTPALGWIMVLCYFIWAGKQIYDDFAGVCCAAPCCAAHARALHTHTHSCERDLPASYIPSYIPNGLGTDCHRPMIYRLDWPGCSFSYGTLSA
jgi:sodium/potassium/calcium exchanger 4